MYNTQLGPCFGHSGSKATYGTSWVEFGWIDLPFWLLVVLVPRLGGKVHLREGGLASGFGSGSDTAGTVTLRMHSTLSTEESGSDCVMTSIKSNGSSQNSELSLSMIPPLCRSY